MFLATDVAKNSLTLYLKQITVCFVYKETIEI
jgi:hypothetical protein